MVRDVVCACECVREMNVVETLQDPDAALVRLSSYPAKHCNVLLELSGGKFLRFGVLGQLQERREGMAVPEEERVRALFRELIEISLPLGLVVEPGKILRRVGIVVLGTFVSDLRLLKADDSATNS